MRCHQCGTPLGFGIYRYCSNKCQASYHIENNTGRAAEFRRHQNATKFCFDYNLGRPCTPHCARYGWRHACQKCGANCKQGEGKHGCAACESLGDSVYLVAADAMQ